MTEIKDNMHLLKSAGEGSQGKSGLMTINIQDSTELIRLACEDLQAVQSVITMSEDHPVYANDHEALIVVRRALGPIISDIEEGVTSIDKALTGEAGDGENREDESESSYTKICKIMSDITERCNALDKLDFGSLCCTLVDEYCSVNNLDSIEVSQWLADNVKIMNEKCGKL